MGKTPFPDFPQQKLIFGQPYPSYYRRQERRKLDCEKASGKSKEVDSSSNVVLTDEKEETDSSDVGMNVQDDHDINSAAEVDNDLMYDDVHGIAQNCREAAVEAEISESAVENDSDTPTVVKVGNEESCANVADTHDIVKTTEDTCIEIADVKLPSHEQTVWAQVSLEASQNPTFLAQDVKRVEEILTRYDHLRRNIVKIDFGQYSTTRNEDGFCHKLDLKLIVDTSRLWENARPYVWKFLGQQEWKYADGSLTTFNRIHVKE